MTLTTRSMCLALAALLTACGDPSDELAVAEDAVARQVVAARPFAGGFYEASGVTHVAGHASILFVDDNRPAHVAWMKLDSAGTPMGEVRLVPLGMEVQDPEDITFDGERYYVVGSQFAKKSGRKTGLVRFKFDALHGRATEVEGLKGLRDLLVAGVPGLPGLDESGAKDGLNIEGLAWHPGEAVLLLGLRSPRAGSDAVILKLKLRNPAAPFSSTNLEVAATPIRLALDGVGIRGMEYDALGERLLIIAGPTEQQSKRPYALWEWHGSSPSRLRYLEDRWKPEGLSRRDGSLLIVCDASMHLILPAD